MGDLDGLAIRYAASYEDQEKVIQAIQSVLIQAREAMAKPAPGMESGLR